MDSAISSTSQRPLSSEYAHAPETFALEVPHAPPMPAPLSQFSVPRSLAGVQLLERAHQALQHQLAAELNASEEGTRRIRLSFVQQEVRVLASTVECCKATLTEADRVRVDQQMQTMADAINKELPEELQDNAVTANEFFDKLIDLIDVIKDQYLGAYTHILDAYQKFFAAFTSNVTSEMWDWVAAGQEGKEIYLNGIEFHKAFDKLQQEFSLPNSAAILFPAPGRPAASQQDAIKWQQALGLPPDTVQWSPSRGYVVVMDLGPIKELKDGTPNRQATWDPARFQVWQSGFNAQEERMKNQLQSLGQKYSNANSYHDNFNRTLSAHLSQFADMLKHMSTW
ncbi:IpaD/SipD/SspD family type III secretion system needle tip protein [Pseudomonas sp. Irchel 3F5]|uniref:IpaD/SipD/SspD family type III secretion system needle tip protein n=1 Tax=Pseudomonas sp. Irchel 3F5 TaxID=2009002 RepID=UPI000BA2DEEE|nr:IpaD/SipD/SspD family type III secretion system needle tip protein [Pseudomonas sp. Irchel 3F5]